MADSNQRSRKRVGVVFGGKSAEHDVSLRSALTIMAALEAAGHEAVPIGITREGQWLTSGDPMAALQAASPLFSIDESRQAGDVVNQVSSLSIQARQDGRGSVPNNGWAGGIDVIFPALHGPMGEDGTVQGLFELADVPYIGAGVMASAVAMDKSITKKILSSAGIPQARWVVARRREWQTMPDQVQEAIEESLGYPCFVKPASLGSSIGISKVRNAEELAEAMNLAAQHDRKIVIEEGIEGQELEVSVLGNDDPIASIVGEIIPGGDHEFYDFEAKYVDDTSELLIPARIPDEAAREIQRLAVQAFREIDCAGIARVDFFLERDTGRVLLNEINTIPGFTAISMYPMLWEASGVPISELVDRLVDLATERYRERND